MKIPESRAAARRYDVLEDRQGKYPAVPEDYGLVHALLFDRPEKLPKWKRRPDWMDKPKFHEPIFLEWSHEEAACGRRMRLVFPVPFDTDEDDACPECLEMADLWATDRDAYDARVREREERRREKSDRRYEAEQAVADYEEFQRRQDAALRGGGAQPIGNADEG